MLKKLLLSTLIGLSLITSTVSADPKAQGDDIHNPNNYRVEYDAENELPLLIPDYFKQVYKDTESPLETYIPMLYTFHYSEEYGGDKQELSPVCVERIYRYYYYDYNGNKVFTGYGEDLNIYNINGKDYISIR